MNISTWEHGTAPHRLRTLILDMPGSVFNGLQHICQSFTNWSRRLMQSTCETKIYVSNTHF